MPPGLPIQLTWRLHSGLLSSSMRHSTSSFTKDLRMFCCPSSLVLAPGPASFTKKSSSSTKVSGRGTTRSGRRYRSRLGRTSSSRKNSSSPFEMIFPGSSIARPSTRIWLFLGRCALNRCCSSVGLLYCCREVLCVFYYMTLYIARLILTQDLLRSCWKRKDSTSVSRQLPCGGSFF